MLFLIALVWLSVSLGLAAQAVTHEQVQKAIPMLETFMKQALNKTGVPGASVVVVYRDQAVYLKGFGIREAGKKLAVTGDTVFQIASLSKAIGSTVIAGLVSDGLVDWDDSAYELDPSIQLSDPWVTEQVILRDLYSHRSGLPGTAGNDIQLLGFDRATIIERLRYLSNGGLFRSTYAYSNYGITSGGVAAATTANSTWEDISESRLYKALGMSSTSSRYSDLLTRQNRASLHIYQNSVNGTFIVAPPYNPDSQSPAGGVTSSARDLGQWLRLQLANGTYASKPIINASALAETHNPIINRGPDYLTGAPTFYGLGYNIDFHPSGKILTGHGGAFSAGARSIAQFSLADNLGIAVLSNAWPSGIPEAAASAFFDYIYYGHATRDWLTDWDDVFFGFTADIPVAAAAFANPPANASAALPLAAYAGTYHNEYVGYAYVNITNNGTLSVILGPSSGGTSAGPGGGISYALRHWDRDVFTYIPYLDSPTAPVTATFEVGVDGRAESVTLESLDLNGLGRLSRV